jgi:signal transduction histidine kinase
MSMGILILATTAEERLAFRQALTGHVPGVVDARDPRDLMDFALFPTVQVVVVEHRNKEVDGLVWIDQLRQSRPELLFVLVAHGEDSRFAVQAIRRGLADYIPRESLDWLGPAVRDLVLAPWRIARPHRHLEKLGLLASAAAHEFSNILTPLQLGIDLLERPLSEERRTPVLEAMSQSLQRGNQLVNTVLALARLQPTECRQLFLEPLLNEAIGHVLRERDVQKQFEENLPPVLGDGVQLRHLCLLLCLHAQQVIPNPGRVQFSLQRKEDSLAETKDLCEAQINSLQLQIVPLLEPLASEIPSPKPGSFVETRNDLMGLSLLVARDIVRRHGGRMDIAKPSGKGTTITVCLPIAQMPAEGDRGEDSDRR